MANLQGWQADPFGLHEQRYFSLGQPTKLVRDGRVESYDPPPSAAVPESVALESNDDRPRLDDEWPRVEAHSPGSTALEPDWWWASNGNQPAEPSPGTLLSPAPGWWLASDGNWYPPELAEPDNAVAPQPDTTLVPADAAAASGAASAPRPGWWLASDGNWYPPQPDAPSSGAAPATAWTSQATSPSTADEDVDASPGPGWWLASDGNWYPPETIPQPSITFGP